MPDIINRPDFALADIVTSQHNALYDHHLGVESNTEKLKAVNELLNICADAKEEAKDSKQSPKFENFSRVQELFEQIKDVSTPELVAMMSQWVENLENQAQKDDPNHVPISKEELKKFERGLSTSNRKVEMDIQTIMSRLSFYKDVLHVNNQIAKSTADAMDRVHQAFLRVGRAHG